MKINKKLCDGLCGELRVIWKNHQGKRYCRSCWSAHESEKRSYKPTRQKKLPSRSPKRIKEEAEYSKKRVPFLEKHSRCQAHLTSICTHYSTDVHHMAGRSGDLYLNEIYWLAVCRPCHMWIETHPIQAREMGLSKSKLNPDL